MTLLPTGAPEFRERFTSFQTSVFGLETLQHCEENQAFIAFVAGQLEPADPHHDAWCAQIAATVQAGKTVQRVHVVREPLTDYARYELTWGSAPTVRAGEDVRVIPLYPSRAWPGDIPEHDFWLFDDAELYRMHHSPEGVVLGVEQLTDRESLDTARAAKHAALRTGIRWNSYLSLRPELARHLKLARA
jgi:hypothetical protein